MPVPWQPATAMAAVAAIFFFVVDQVIGLGVRALFNVGI
jgi:hypothetical protein